MLGHIHKSMSPYVIPILLSPKKDMRVDGYVCR